MNTDTVMRYFRILGFMEASSLLLLMFIAMPLKYIWSLPIYVKILGSAHGALFVIYCLMALGLAKKFKWELSTLIYCLVLACLPFGTIYFDYKYCR